MLMPLLRGENPVGWRDLGISSLCIGRTAGRNIGRMTLVTRDYTYLYLGSTGYGELYDVHNDLDQQHNLATERPQVLRDLYQQLLERLTQLGTPSDHLESRCQPPRASAASRFVESRPRSLALVEERSARCEEYGRGK